MNVAQAIADILVTEGVRVAAGITGSSVGAVADALAEAEEIKLCYTHSERVAVDIADGYARITGQPGVIFTDHGPGVANTMAGILNSYGDSVPVLFLAGGNNRFEVPGRTQKELAIQDVFRPVTKWTGAIHDPSQTEDVLRRAFVALRTGRSGPVVIETHRDVWPMPAPPVDYRPLPRRFRSAADPQDVEHAIRALAAAERPYVYAGAGVLFAEATPELIELAELLTLPVSVSLNGKSAFPDNHPLSLGIGGVSRATYATLHAARFAEEADLILAIGCGFKGHVLRSPIRPGVTLIQVEVDPYELHKEVRADQVLLGDAKLVLRQMLEAARALLPAGRLLPRPAVIDRIAAARKEWMAASRPLLTSTERPINPFRVTWELTQLLDPDQAIVLHDAGSVRGAVCQHYLATVPHSFIGYGVQSAMGWTIGAAMGAGLAAPDKLVVAVTGEEALGETALDLETAVCGQIPFLLVLLNNRSQRSSEGGASVRMAQIRSRQAMDYCALAQALGVRSAIRVEDPEALPGALREGARRVQGGEVAVVEVASKRVPVGLHYLWEQSTSSGA